MVRKAAGSAGALVAITAAACACSPVDDQKSPSPTVLIQSTQFAAAPPPITDLVPTPEQLTTLYDATTDYSIREEDRSRLLDGPGDQRLQIARSWGALPMPQYIQFTTVEPDGPDRVDASGQGIVDGIARYPVGPIPFVRSDDEWRLSHLYVCGVLAGLPGPDSGCQ